jgi:hypothetical protein
MANRFERYGLWVHCGTQDTSLGTEAWSSRGFDAWQDPSPINLRPESNAGVSTLESCRFQLALGAVPDPEHTDVVTPILFGMGISELEKQFFTTSAEKYMRQRREAGLSNPSTGSD